MYDIKKYYLIITISICFFIGIVVYAIASNAIIILSPFSTQKIATSQAIVSKKKVTLYFWSNDNWKHENVDIIWTENIHETVQYLLIAWLSLLEEEKVHTKKISLQSVAISPSQKEVFISFDRNPFNKKNSTYEKWLWVESLLKTLRENNIPLKFVQLLIHHQPPLDYHLDFSKPWPIEGFL